MHGLLATKVVTNCYLNIPHVFPVYTTLFMDMVYQYVLFKVEHQH